MARVVFSACLPGEYEYEGECCPQCPSGNVVKNHCTDAVSTVCIPCVDNTYMDHPNGETKCLRCKICDKGAGLVTKKACTYTSNTVCDCERGSFCRSVSGKECDMCERHKTCPPGEMVKRYGTNRMDTECEKCPEGTFRNKTMSNCTKWTACASGIIIQQGTSTNDTICKTLHARKRWILFLSGLCMCALAVYIYFINDNKEKQSIQETRPFQPNSDLENHNS
ncbi:tumor necrosis factor receptor superfamily member 14 isoform X1 [Pelobates cultripes]|nr:tumor necrosis factor receptor superfamily member 14 isoform X1 [Pelobates cultripes]